jgi:uncharacterized protein (DUF302 family)
MTSPGIRMVCKVVLIAAAALAIGWGALAHDPLHRQRVPSRHDFQTTLTRLEQAVAANGLGIVTRANAQNGARSLGQTIPGNQVWGVFGPRFALRMLQASVDAGIEAPLRLYIVEAPGGRVTVSYVQPSEVFAPYGSQELDAMAAELDDLLRRIVSEIR